MVGKALPGRPGTLTNDQEVKLQEFWNATLKVFGVEDPESNANGVEENDDDQHSRPETFSSEKQKKKKRSMFGRKHQGDDAEAGQQQSLSAATDPEDKYGQTKAFHHVVATQSPESLRRAFWSMVKHDHPDGLLLRFLRARKWDVQHALVMLISTMHWRLQEMNVDDDLMKNGEGAALADSLNPSNPVAKKEGNNFLTQLRMGKSYLHGTDREGRPMCFVRVRLHKQGEQSEASLERFTVYVIETARLLLAANVDTAAIVFDMTGFSMANMDYGPVKFMIKCFEANYPESLGVVLVHKAPWIFQGIWSIIKNWLDPVVASKVHFTKTVSELEMFIAPAHIPHELGGQDPYTYTYVEPLPGENKRMEKDIDTRLRLLEERAGVVKAFEKATREWISAGVGSGGAGSGGVGGNSSARAKREELAGQLRSGYWALDPYVRARSVYDRTGVIGEGGRIRFYPNDPPTPPAPRSGGPLPAGEGDNVD